jgi:arsenite methyltransferase
LKYEPELIQAIPEDAVNSYCGVGNPFSLGPLQAGERVLDIGCCGGVDTMVAAMKVGSNGISVGIDMTYDMVARVRRNLQETQMDHVSYNKNNGLSRKA